jgi:hypothetical protein
VSTRVEVEALGTAVVVTLPLATDR